MSLVRHGCAWLLASLAAPAMLFPHAYEITGPQTDIRITSPFYVKTDWSVPLDAALKQPFLQSRTTQIQIGDREALWLKISVINRTDSDQLLALRHEFPWTDHVEFYALDSLGKLVAHVKAGDRKPGKRIDAISTLRFSAAPNQAFTLIARIQTTVQAGTVLHLLSSTALEGYAFLESAVQGVFAGIVLMLLLFHANLFMATRDKTIGRYLAYLAAIGIFMPLRSGVLQQNLFGNYGHWGDYLWPFLVSAAYYTALRFARSFLSLDKTMPVVDRLLGYLQIACIAPVFALALGRRESFIVENAVGILSGPPLLALGIYCAVRKRNQAVYFVLGYSLPIGAAIADNLVENGLLPVFAGRNEMLPVAIASEFLLFAIVLYRKLSDIELERTLDRERLSRLDAELAFARILHRGLLPNANQRLGNISVEVVSTSQYAIGADYFDLVETDEGVLHLLLFDAGDERRATFLTAALDASASRMAFRNGLAEGGNAGEVCERISTLLTGAIGERSVAFTYCRVNTKTGEYSLANLKNPEPVLLKNSSERMVLSEPLDHGRAFATIRQQLLPGDILCMSTRGLTRHVNLVRDRLPPKERAEWLRRRISRIAAPMTNPARVRNSRPAADHLTLLMLEYAGQS